MKRQVGVAHIRTTTKVLICSVIHIYIKKKIHKTQEFPSLHLNVTDDRTHAKKTPKQTEILEHHVPHVQLSVHTWNQLRMIMNEKSSTRTPTHREEGIDSVMGFKKNTQHGEHKPIRSLLTLKSDGGVRECFCVSRLTDEEEPPSVFQLQKQQTKKGFLCRTVGGLVLVCWWSPTDRPRRFRFEFIQKKKTERPVEKSGIFSRLSPRCAAAI